MKKILLFAFCFFITFSIYSQSAGDVIINEIMQNPSTVSDANGEWFEVYNTTGSDIDLDGWDFSDAGNKNFTVSGSLILTAGGYIVFGLNTDLATNGGVPVDYDWGTTGTFNLTNNDDEIIITAPNSIEIDRVEYDGGPDFPSPNGASMFLDNPASDNNMGSNWEISTTAWTGSSGDLGTPGETNLTATPITLAAFTAKPMDQKSVTLDWITSSEENNDYFSIEHSTDGRDFESVDMVDGALHSVEMQYYNYVHKDAVNGDNYYRLRQVDTDGTFSFSPIEVVRLTSGVEVDVRPTLAESVVTITIADAFDNDVDIEVLDILGRTVIAQTLGRGDLRVELPVSDLQKGHYFVRVKNGAESRVARFIKR